VAGQPERRLVCRRLQRARHLPDRLPRQPEGHPMNPLLLTIVLILAALALILFIVRR
jgi:hypothetical protein